VLGKAWKGKETRTPYTALQFITWRRDITTERLEVIFSQNTQTSIATVSTFYH
jgi:hypothetical protein